jgi:hypothetical protein
LFYEKKKDQAVQVAVKKAQTEWENATEGEKVFKQIMERVLGPGPKTFRCPAWFAALQRDGGCMAMHHNGTCNTCFCAFCFQTFAEDATPNSHAHATVCEFNRVNRRNYDLPTGRDSDEDFYYITCARELREIERIFLSLSPNMVVAVRKLLDPVMASRGQKVL